MLEELAHRVRSEAIDPIDLVEESIRRIEAAPGLNAVTEVFADEARERASRHDRQGPLAGLPLLVKDLARVEGHRTTFGSLLYAQAPPDTHDDVAVARLRAAGAIVLGRTNSPEFGAVGFTSNRLYGPTRNPWNPSTSPGGSSGGSAAALAAGLAPLATSSDGGGSTRGPALFCGLVGHKPTMGTIGRNFLPRWIEFSTQGSTAATVADVVLQLRVMRGGAPGDFLALPGGSADVEPRLPRTIYAVRTYRADVDARVEANFHATLDALASSGLAVQWVDSPSDERAVTDWFTISAAELAQSLRDVQDQSDQMTDYVQFNLRYAESISLDAYLAAMRRRFELSLRYDELLGSDCVVLTPTANCQSFDPEGPLPTSAGRITGDATIALNTTDANFTGHPATSVPMGLDDHGVPTGVQITGPRGGDDLTLGVAARLEQIRPWPLCAPGYTPFSI